MATIVIKDLQESVELDREAMLAISGGARFRSRAAQFGRPPVRGRRIVDYAPKQRGTAPPAAKKPGE